MMSRFASSGLVPEKWETIAPFYEALQKETVTPDNMEGWLKQWSDLHIVLEDAIFAAYRAVSENTADAEAEQKYMHFVEEIQPKVATAEQLLAEKMLDISDSAIPESKMEAVRRLKNWAALYNEKNLAINTEIAKLGNEYDKTVGAMTVAIDGKEQTMQQAGEHQFNVDRNHREKAWHIVQERWLIDRAVLDQLFLEMLALRREIAGNAGFSDFRDYKWRNLSRFTYTPQDCLALHEAIEQEVIPVVRKYTTRKAAQMSIKTLRPWDSNVDALGRKALRPFETVAQLEDGIQRIFNRIDPVLGSHFNRMRDGNLDLESRRNKAPGAYCGGFHQTGKPYIFANVIG
ncbi:MAG TPA: oligoendopeptidase F, partial [Firmicutes bacterium]|nr:oligoendopeptidase F [Bacillota bacterium]